MATAGNVSFADVLSDILAPEAPTMPPDVAHWALSLHLSEERKERLLLLAELGNRGELTEEQRQEIAAYRDVGNLLSILHAKARLSLRDAGRVE